MIGGGNGTCEMPEVGAGTLTPVGAGAVGFGIPVSVPVDDCRTGCWPVHAVCVGGLSIVVVFGVSVIGAR
jgi:hypothetical protein